MFIAKIQPRLFSVLTKFISVVLLLIIIVLLFYGTTVFFSDYRNLELQINYDSNRTSRDTIQTLTLK